MLRVIIPILILSLLVFLCYKEYEGFEDNLLHSAVTQPSAIPIKPTVSDTVMPQNTVIPSVSVSGTAYDAMSLQQRSEVLKDIQQAVKNEILANRQTEVLPVQSSQAQSNVNQTNAIQQGNEFNIKKQNTVKDVKEQLNGGCPPIPDMSDYIRKDQIPCWNCTLDY
jgi:hypothetical protein